MKIIEIQLQGQIIIIDYEDLELYNSRSWSILNGGYVWSNVGDLPRTGLHNLIMNYYGNLDIDHKNRNKLDNRKENLRLCTVSQNHMNKRPYVLWNQSKNASQYKGVCWHIHKKKWMVTIQFMKHKHFVGYFKDEIEAAKAYDKKAYELCKEFAYLNFPNDYSQT